MDGAVRVAVHGGFQVDRDQSNGIPRRCYCDDQDTRKEKKRNSRGFDSLTLNDLDLSTHLQADRFARIDVQVHNVLAGCGWW